MPIMLLDAYYDENPEKIEQLLQRGADVNLKDDEGLTPLMQAASFGEYEIAQLLIKYGADVNMISDEFIPKGWTPLMFAIDRKSGEIARLLLQHDADVNKPATAGETPLILAVQKKILILSDYCSNMMLTLMPKTKMEKRRYFLRCIGGCLML